MLNRDSVVWWIVLIASIAGYLATVPSPLQWTWAQSMNAIVVICGLLAAQFSASKLPGAQTPPKDTTTILGGLLSVYTKKKEE